MIYRFLVLLVLLAAPIVIADCDGTVEVESSDADHWQARLLLVSDVDIESWAVDITFDMEVDFIESAMADVTGSGKAWTLTNKEWDGGLNAGDELSLRFIVIHSSAEQPFPTDVTFNDEVLCHKVTWDCSDAFVVEGEESGSWTGLVAIPGPLNGWTLGLGFSTPVDLVESAAATATGSDDSWELVNKEWDAEIPDGQNLSVHFIVNYSGERPGLTKLDLDGSSLCREQCVLDCSSSIELSDITATSFQALMVLPGPLDGWEVALDFSAPISNIESPMAEVQGAGQLWTLNNLNFDGEVEAGSSLELRFKVLFSGAQPDLDDVRLNKESLCSTGVEDCVPPQPSTTSLPNPTDTGSPTSPTTSQKPGACACDSQTIKDPNCLNCANDPFGCLGCQACGVADCRFCGFGEYAEIPC